MAVDVDEETASIKPRFVLRRRDQCTLAVLTFVALAGMGLHQALDGRGFREVKEAARERPRSLRFQVDVNSASWPELTVLPMIGPVRAQGIVKSREIAGPFQGADSLQRVHGIGPKTALRIKRYLTSAAPSARDAPSGQQRNQSGGAAPAD